MKKNTRIIMKEHSDIGCLEVHPQGNMMYGCRFLPSKPAVNSSTFDCCHLCLHPISTSVSLSHSPPPLSFPTTLVSCLAGI